jgi:hypothetical protein
MTLHHIHTLDTVLSGFAGMLTGGGHLCVVDLEEEDGSFHSDDIEGHRGFTRSSLASQLAAAGFTCIAFQDCYNLVRDGVTYPLFLATCVRGVTTRAP